MRHLRCAKSFLVLCLASAGLASAQITITNVSNAGSRLPASSTSSGIAQGALFVVAARGIGPADIQQASFPLPTTDGLAGVTIQVSVGGATLDAIMVYVAPDEVAAILPSLTPIGTGTIKVTSNGVSRHCADQSGRRGIRYLHTTSGPRGYGSGVQRVRRRWERGAEQQCAKRSARAGRASTDCLRIAAQSLEINGSPIVAQFLREQADKNISLLLPWVKQ